MIGVALRKESVDRNFQVCIVARGLFQSLSARRAWIEIPAIETPSVKPPVALRKESVDRNCPVALHIAALRGSLSARRAWIEIQRTPFCS